MFSLLYIFHFCLILSVSMVLLLSIVLDLVYLFVFFLLFFLCVCCVVVLFFFAICLGFCLSVWFIFLFVFFLSFVFLWTHCAVCGLLVPQPGVGPGPPLWEHQVQDTGPPENSQAQGILTGMHSSRGIHLDTKTWLHLTACRLQCWTPHTKNRKTGTESQPSADRLPKVVLTSQTPQNTPPDTALPIRGKRLSSTHQRTGWCLPVPPTRKPTQGPGPISPTRGQTTEERGTMTLQPAERRP